MSNYTITESKEIVGPLVAPPYNLHKSEQQESLEEEHEKVSEELSLESQGQLGTQDSGGSHVASKPNSQPETQPRIQKAEPVEEASACKYLSL